MKKWRLMALLAVVALLVAACGDDAEETTTTTAAPTTTTAAPFEGLSYAAPDCTYGGEFSKIEAVDALTVRFELCFPDVAFRSKVAFSAFAIQSSDHLEATGGGGDALISNPIGTGPYMLEQWDRGNQLILTKNPNYWGDPAIAETLVFRWSTEAAQRLVELQAGSVDGIDNIGPEDFATVANDPNLQLIERPALNIFYIGFNNNFPPLDNEQVRQALAMAIDKQRIIDNFYPAGSSVANSFLPPAIPGFSAEAMWWEYNQQTAREMLAAAGFPDGFDIELSYRDVVRGYLPQPAVVAVDIQAQLAEIGVNVTLNVMESGAYIDAADAGELPMHLLGWGADYPDATNFYDYHFGAGSSDQFGTKFDDITALLTQAGIAGRPGRARRALRPGGRADQAARAHDPRGARRLRPGLQGRRRRGPCQPAVQRDLLGHGPGRPGHPGLDAERRAHRPLLRRRVRRREPARLRADQRVAAGLRGRRRGHRALPGHLVRRQRRPDGVDLQPA